jgi:hypothetical protein
MPCEEFCSDGVSPLIGVPVVVPAYEDMHDCFEKQDEQGTECNSVNLYAQLIGPACIPASNAGHIRIVAGFSAACCQSREFSDMLPSKEQCIRSSQCPEDKPICLKSKPWKFKGDCVPRPTPHISLVEDKPLERKIFWDDIPSAAFQKVKCCIEEGTCVSTGSIDCNNGQCSATVDFESIVTGEDSFSPNMASYASNEYE